MAGEREQGSNSPARDCWPPVRVSCLGNLLALAGSSGPFKVWTLIDGSRRGGRGTNVGVGGGRAGRRRLAASQPLTSTEATLTRLKM